MPENIQKKIPCSVLGLLCSCVTTVVTQPNGEDGSLYPRLPLFLVGLVQLPASKALSESSIEVEGIGQVGGQDGEGSNSAKHSLALEAELSRRKRADTPRAPPAHYVGMYKRRWGSAFLINM
jgi:hypothetical protein